jgi:hypothetical protein
MDGIKLVHGRDRALALRGNDISGLKKVEYFWAAEWMLLSEEGIVPIGWVGKIVS